MAKLKPIELFSSSYIHIFFDGYTKANTWWLKNEEDWWSGAYTFTGNVLYFVTQGGFDLRIENKLYHVQEGDMVYIPANVAHERFITSSAPFRKYYCSFDLSFGKDPLHHFFQMSHVTRITDIEGTSAIFQALIDHNRNKLHAYSAIGQNGALLMLLSIFLKESQSPLLFTDDRIERTMLIITDFINANLHRTITVDELAHLSGYCRDHFTKIFKSHFGCLPLQYISDLKLEYAKKRLTETRHPISSIAEELGYCDSSYFGKFFKNKTGLSPSQYRETVKHTI
ncbi:MAG: helix-turn-helix transcriptional regulator [Clostridia bacterium]|nr:helix-turn-helix transcriptional regulator [Clostridia bacterium]